SALPAELWPHNKQSILVQDSGAVKPNLSRLQHKLRKRDHAGRLIHDSARGEQGAAGKYAAIAGAMAQLQALALGQVVDGVLAGDITATDGVHADLAGRACLTARAASVDDVGVQGLASCSGPLP